ncbi:MAG: methylenetetrahydrofolate--tRNA-(uracil(54)-C(5))-methyltransferase (FADH(2)-oxidizing) TrmFO [Deltaproteobacteria bacterium]|nr:methylenetetrahydrofolate--tRNA-(uracil(54)-C(5))-methyltransferase (FADH(2)-oxidizing) TrmFO [Deltaproteobacteria bacterium]
MTNFPDISIIGAGLAGCEAAWQLARRNIPVTLYEMKPERFSPAHSNPDFAELVCSNSLRADRPTNAAGLLKEEMRRLGSLIMDAATKTKVAAGNALAVDRQAFAREITEKIENHPLITTIRTEITALPDTGIVIIASGPLTSDALTATLTPLVGERLHFYDATAPIISAESIDYNIAFRANRYAETGETGDYINCPLNEEQYLKLIETIAEGDRIAIRDFEDLQVFEGCMPIETMVARGPLTLAFGPLKPKGLIDPKTGREAYAIVQLRSENESMTMFNLVGFQTRLTFPWQERVIHLIPGLEKAEILRFGTMHRNTFIDAPKVLNKFFQHKTESRIFFAGQISGVEGYPESTASGLIVGLQVVALVNKQELLEFPGTTALGALTSHINNIHSKNFQPMNINFGLFPPLEGKKRRKRERLEAKAERAREDRKTWLAASYFCEDKTIPAN